MLKNLSISGFRTFRELHIDRLTRVNLFVGTNNAGKTSILEAAELLARGTREGLLSGPLRRSEEIPTRDDNARRRSEIDPSHLFHGHALTPGVSFEISGDGDIQRFVSCEVIVQQDEEPESSQELSSVEAVASGFALSLHSHVNKITLRITSYGSIRRVAAIPFFYPHPPVNFLGVDAISRYRLKELWDEVVLEPEEEGVIEALRIIDPRIERVAFTGASNIVLRLSDSEQRLPLGSVGDGLKRLLALALHLFSAKGGFLLVDEIDTGLHHTVMVNMWKLVIETARRLDLQVLATSHSLDCVHALAWVREQNPDLASDVTMHRVEKDATKTVAFTSDELLIAAQNHLELR